MIVCKKYLKLLGLLAARRVQLTGPELKAMSRCFGQRGQYKGYLKKSAPQDPLERAIYAAITPNPYKIPVFSLMMLPDDCRETYQKLCSYSYPDWLDLDKEQLTKLNVW